MSSHKWNGRGTWLWRRERGEEMEERERELDMENNRGKREWALHCRHCKAMGNRGGYRYF